MNLSTLIHPSSPVGTWLHKRGRKKYEARTLRKQQQNFDRIVAIAVEYGYAPDSPEVRAIWDDTDRDRVLDNIVEEEWRSSFNPADEEHFEYRDGVLVIKNFPMMIATFTMFGGAARGDVVRIHLPEGWEQSCDRIVIRSHETTFYAGETPLVIFYASGRKMHGGSWARTWNALDVIKTYTGIELDHQEIAIPDCSTYPDYVIEKFGDVWAWPICQAA